MTGRRPAVGVESFVAPLFPVPAQPRDEYETHNLARELTDLAAKRGGGGAVVRKLPTVTLAAAARPWQVSGVWPLVFWGAVAVLFVGCAVWTWRGERR
ncbi:hypothetical protein BH24ACT15_BH24ACT15_30370 [soil metagenome]